MSEERSPEAAAEAPSREGRTGLLRRLIGAVAPTFIVLFALEAALRVGTAAWHGGNEYYLFYGVHGLVGRFGVSPWSVYDGSHYKFPPDYTLQSAAGQGEETATTNSLGFRGPDFDPEKPPGTFRVVTLGGSSTFGFHNTDEGTYARHLQALFVGREGPPRVEAINAGFPYYTSASIRSLLEAELLDYEPDLLTLYAAYNDASWPLHTNWFVRGVFWVQQHSIIYLLLKETILPDEQVYRIQNRIRRSFPQGVDVARIDAEADTIAARYRRNVEAIADSARARGIRLLLIRQPMTTVTVNPGIDSLPYEEEYEAVRAGLAGGDYANPFEIRMIYHHRLLRELDSIARERGLRTVDNVEITDRDRSRLTTWVHLTEEANLRLAEALRDTIERYHLPRDPEAGGSQDAVSSAASDAARPTAPGAARSAVGRPDGG